MNTTSHTPGPVDKWGFLQSLDGCTYHFSHDMGELTIRAPEGCKIGLTLADKIAAAPELLEALMTAKAILFEHVFAHDNSYVNAEQQITAAIAKATQA